MSSVASSTVSNPNSNLSQANFLQLLVTQMSSQDPLDPQSDTQFAAELAQFSSLQQTQNMSQNLSALQATSMIGDQVTASPSNGTAPVTGLVSGVSISSGVPSLVVNGQPFTINEVSSVTPPSASSTSNATQTPTN